MNPAMRAHLTQRLQSPWLYRGADAVGLQGVSPAQKNYALTLRLQLLDCLQKQVEPIATIADSPPRAREFYLIGCALRREIRRTHRAARRLASKVPA